MAEYKGSKNDGKRQARLEAEQQNMKKEFELQRKQITKDNQVSISTAKFVTEVGNIEASLKQSTVGLVKLEDFQRIKNELEELKRKEANQKLNNSKKDKKKKKKTNKLSFETDEPEEGEVDKTQDTKRVKFGKDPTVDTFFLPDREREEQELKLREELKQRWLEEQEQLKLEPILVTYSYWDGTGHRNQVECKKGDTIAHFLEKCKAQCYELRGVNVDNLLYVKEDIIIPHHYKFYDFIVNKARGKTGPLFAFDVHEDVRFVNDATVEKDETHAGKVMEKSWYDKNKHIFPANRWELFDPEKNYGQYRLKDSHGNL